MTVARIMTKVPVTITPDDTLADAKHRMRGLFRHLPVTEDGKLVGIITDRDLRRYDGYLDCTRVNAAMTAAPATVAPSTAVERAAGEILKLAVGGLPVIDQGKLVGIVTTSDLLRALVEMLGTHREDVARVDVVLDGQLDGVAAIQIAAEVCGEVLGCGSYDDDGEGRIFFVRVASADARAVADALRENNFRVLAVHL